MSTINISVIDQSLQLNNNPIIASGGVNEDSVKFNFDSTWNGLTKKATFYKNPQNVYTVNLDGNNEAIIPYQVLETEGTIFIGVFGTSGSTVKTSEICSYTIVKGSSTDVEPQESDRMKITVTGSGNNLVSDKTFTEIATAWANGIEPYVYYKHTILGLEIQEEFKLSVYADGIIYFSNSYSVDSNNITDTEIHTIAIAYGDTVSYFVRDFYDDSEIAMKNEIPLKVNFTMSGSNIVCDKTYSFLKSAINNGRILVATIPNSFGYSQLMNIASGDGNTISFAGFGIDNNNHVNFAQLTLNSDNTITMTTVQK